MARRKNLGEEKLDGGDGDEIGSDDFGVCFAGGEVKHVVGVEGGLAGKVDMLGAVALLLRVFAPRFKRLEGPAAPS